MPETSDDHQAKPMYLHGEKETLREQRFLYAIQTFFCGAHVQMPATSKTPMLWIAPMK